MKRIVVLLILLSCFFVGCKKTEESFVPEITDVVVVSNQDKAYFSVQVNFPGPKEAVLEVGSNEQLTECQRYSMMQLDEYMFDYQIDGLEETQTYYFRMTVSTLNFTLDSGKKSFIANTNPGVLFGLFSIGENKRIRFSQGNLQYIGSAATPYWRFADNQLSFLGDNGQGSTAHNVDRDLFGWGTSGWNCGNKYYRPYDTDGANNNYDPYYGPRGAFNLTDSYANSDWGVYNAIKNGGNVAGQWRTLSSKEWNYLAKQRNASTINGVENARYVYVKVDGMLGVILFPDMYHHPDDVSLPMGINRNDDCLYSESNRYEINDWLKMEENGAVFLPSAGQRDGVQIMDINVTGAYWSSSCNETFPDVAADLFYYTTISIGVTSSRSVGSSVRLVQDVE